MNQSHNKPECKLIGENGNIFNLVAIASRTLREHGLQEQAEELTNKILNGEANSYHHALAIIMEYVEIV